MAPPEASIYDRITNRLAPYLGAFNAEVWVKVVAERELGVAPDDLTAADVENVLEGLRPSLNTFMGRAAAGELLAKIRGEVA
jgi:hypothetical protein